MAVTALLRLGKLTDRGDLVAKAERTLQSFAGLMGQHSRATGQMLLALDFMLNRPCEIVVIPDDAAASTEEATAAIRLIRGRFLPNKVVTARIPNLQRSATKGAEPDRVVPLLAGKQSIDRKVSVYICENYSCRAPVVGLDALTEALRQR